MYIKKKNERKPGFCVIFSPFFRKENGEKMTQNPGFRSFFFFIYITLCVSFHFLLNLKTKSNPNLSAFGEDVDISVFSFLWIEQPLPLTSNHLSNGYVMKLNTPTVLEEKVK